MSSPSYSTPVWIYILKHGPSTVLPSYPYHGDLEWLEVFILHSLFSLMTGKTGEIITFRSDRAELISVDRSNVKVFLLTNVSSICQSFRGDISAGWDPAHQPQHDQEILIDANKWRKIFIRASGRSCLLRLGWIKFVKPKVGNDS